MRRREPGPAELEALDPVTGESLARTSPVADGEAGVERSARARRLRRLALLAATLAVGCAAAAGYFGLSIAQLRGVERTWRAAMALDAARADADRQVRDALGDASTGVEDEGAQSALGAIGTEVAVGLRRHERALAERRIFDSKVSALRDRMVEALEFRRFQLSPTRNRMGGTPLQQVEAGIAEQLDRWGLSPTRVDRPEVASLGPALAQLRRYADVETGATLFALDGTTLHTIDVDRSVRQSRQLPGPGRLVETSGGVAVVDGSRLVVYPPDPSGGPVATIDQPVLSAVAAGDGSGDLWVIQGASTSVRRFHVDGADSAWVGDPVPLPANHIVVGSTFHHLVLESMQNGLLLWLPSESRPARMLASEGARFLDAEGSLVLWQGPLPLTPRGSTDFLHRFDVGTGRRDLIGLPRTDAAAAALGPHGVAAIAAGPLAGRLGSILLLARTGSALVGGSGPRASVEPGSIAWTEDGEALFWLTPDGAVAMASGEGVGRRQLVRTGLEGLDQLTVMVR